MNDNQISPDTTQVQAVADKMIPEGSKSQPPLTGGEKEELRVVFPTPLELSPDQETRMVDYAMSRIDSLEKELGLPLQLVWGGRGHDR